MSAGFRIAKHKILQGEIDVSVFACSSLLHQIEIISELFQDIYKNKKIAIIICNEQMRRMVFSYFNEPSEHKTTKNFFSSSKEVIFFELILIFFSQNYSSSDLLALLKIGYCFFNIPETEYLDYIFYLEKNILSSKASITNIFCLEKWIDPLTIAPEGFYEFMSLLVDVLKKMSQFDKKSFNLSEIWREHLYFSSLLTGKKEWWIDNFDFCNFVTEFDGQSLLKIPITLSEYRDLIKKSLNNHFNIKYDLSSNIIICDLKDASLINADVFFILEFTDNNFTCKTNQFMFSSNIKQFTNDEIITDFSENLEYFISLFYKTGAQLILMYTDTKNFSPWINDIINFNFEKKTKKVTKISSYVDPYPCPDVSIRPLILSITKLNSLINNPYGFYIENILNLKEEPKVDCQIQNNDIGDLLHYMANLWIKRVNIPTDKEIKDIVVEWVENRFGKIPNSSENNIFLLPVINNIIRNFIERNVNRLQDCFNVFGEIAGQISFIVGDKRVVVKSRCDRIEINKNNKINIIDYKTGSMSSLKKDELKLQLVIPALIAMEGGFDCIKNTNTVDELIYWDLKNNELNQEEYNVNFFIKVKNNIQSLLEKYLDSKNGFFVYPETKRRYFVPIHDHFARIQEKNY